MLAHTYGVDTEIRRDDDIVVRCRLDIDIVKAAAGAADAAASATISALDWPTAMGPSCR